MSWVPGVGAGVTQWPPSGGQRAQGWVCGVRGMLPIRARGLEDGARHTVVGGTGLDEGRGPQRQQSRGRQSDQPSLGIQAVGLEQRSCWWQRSGRTWPGIWVGREWPGPPHPGRTHWRSLPQPRGPWPACWPHPRTRHERGWGGQGDRDRTAVTPSFHLETPRVAQGDRQDLQARVQTPGRRPGAGVAGQQGVRPDCRSAWAEQALPGAGVLGGPRAIPEASRAGLKPHPEQNQLETLNSSLH